MKINKISEHKGIQIGKPNTPRPTEEEVNSAIQNLLSQNAITEDKEGPSLEGDTVNIDFEGFESGVAFEGGKAEKYDLVLGSHTFIPGFEDQLIGHKKGDYVEVNVTFPENYQADNLKGKPAVFKCKINNVLVKKPAELNDDFAKQFGLNNVDELKTALENQIYVQNANKELNEYIGKVWKHIIDNCDIEFEDNEMESKIDEAASYYENMMKQYGSTLEQYLQMSNMTMEDFRKQLKPDAINMMTMDVVTAQIIKDENLTVSENEIDDEIAHIKSYYNLPDEEVKNIKENQIEEVKKEVLKAKISKILLQENN